MLIQVRVPSPGESITTVQIANWLVANESGVDKDMELCEIETDKATLILSAEASGKISIIVAALETVDVGSVIATIDTEFSVEKKAITHNVLVEEMAMNLGGEKKAGARITPLAKAIMQENNITEENINKEQVSKKDVLNFMSTEVATVKSIDSRPVERVKMSLLRKKLAERLVAVRQETAILTTFNEVNMAAIISIRKEYGVRFKAKYGVSLGFMTFFAKSVIKAMNDFPQINAKIENEDIVYHKYVDLGIAVSTPKGLMVPVVRNAHNKTFSESEMKIGELAVKARDGKISIDELTGGTFTITNGGVFGSLLSTPLLNPPQCAILGMHKIMERPMAVEGNVVILPMMYIALSYDHRLIDGKESVGFIVKVKEILENPLQLIFDGDVEKSLFS